MKWLFLILLLVPGVLAAPVEYWAVGDSVEDVINAANFAASMRGSAGVSFTGKTREQMDDALSTISLNDVVIVTFSGKRATIRSGGHSEFDAVEENALVYLRREGFSVEVSEPDVDRALLDDTTDVKELPSEKPKEEPEEDPTPTLYAHVDPPQQIDPPSLELEAGPDVEPVPIEEPDEPGFFTRIWSWFAGLFS